MDGKFSSRAELRSGVELCVGRRWRVDVPPVEWISFWIAISRLLTSLRRRIYADQGSVGPSSLPSFCDRLVCAEKGDKLFLVFVFWFSIYLLCICSENNQFFMSKICSFHGNVKPVEPKFRSSWQPKCREVPHEELPQRQ